MSNLIFPQGQASYAAVEMLQSSHIQDQYKKLMVVVAAATTNIGVNTLFLVIWYAMSNSTYFIYMQNAILYIITTCTNTNIMYQCYIIQAAI